jgi:hypothetical protein
MNFLNNLPSFPGFGILNSLLSGEKNFLLQFKWFKSSLKSKSNDIYFPNEFVLGLKRERQRMERKCLHGK